MRSLSRRATTDKRSRWRRLLGVNAVIVMPHDAPQAKRAAALDYRAEVIGYDRYAGDPDVVLRRVADERGLTPVPPFDRPDVMADQGTVGKELIEQAGELDVIVTPFGGGRCCRVA